MASKYSDWQILRIRRALKAYYQFTRYLKDDFKAFDSLPDKEQDNSRDNARDKAKKKAKEKAERVKSIIQNDFSADHKMMNVRPDDNFLSWEEADWYDVIEAIYSQTGVKFEHEAIRRFAVGYPGKNGLKKIQIPRDKNKIRAIVDFLTHEDVGYLSQDELTQDFPSMQAAVRLNEFLDRFETSDRTEPASKLKGTYRQQRMLRDGFVNFDLSLQSPADSGIMQAFYLEEFVFVDKPVTSPYPEIDRSKASINHYSGWAIYTPEEGLLIYLKDEEEGINRFFVAVGTDFGAWEGKDVNNLCLLEYQSPISLDESVLEGSEYHTKIFDSSSEMIWNYKRLPEFSEGKTEKGNA